MIEIHIILYPCVFRVIELSMWGNIAVEETVDVRHNGAQLKVLCVQEVVTHFIK